MKKKGQISLEFLLVLLGFFSALAIVLPAVSASMHSFFEASDSALAKQIAAKIQDEASSFEFLGDGSKMVFEFVPSEKITVSSEGNRVFFSTSSKKFEAVFNAPQNVPQQDFAAKFFVEIEKINGEARVKAYSK